MRSFLLSIGFFLLVSSVTAQQRDTLQLREIVVYGLPVTTYTTGSKVEKISTNGLVRTLADGLSGEASIYLKNYGNQQLSTIALRGTTASQTAVLWNGININSPTLGQTDFSLIPLFLFDEISVHHGAGSSLYGSDAIGGSILIGNSQPDFTESFHAALSQQLGSFGRTNTGLKFRSGSERWQSSTKLYHAYIDNDFSYNSPAVGFRKKQKHASVQNFGVNQQVHYKISDQQIVSLEAMYTDNHREVQPSVTNDAGNETLENRNLRSAINYTNESRVGIIHGTVAYQFSNQDYTDDRTETVQSSQLTGQVNIDKEFNNRSNVRYGLSYNYYTASAKNFDNVSEDRYDAFVSYRYALLESWILNLNIRQSLYDHRYAPLSPTLGTEVRLLKKNANCVDLRAQIARGFRIPTLDDRYWNPGGNPLTKPEDAIHAEVGGMWSKVNDLSAFKVDVSYYQSWIDKMIVWMPEDGVWSPFNLQEVDIKGVEFESQYQTIIAKVKVQASADYSYTQSLNKEGMPPGDPTFVSKQLPYVPIHDARASLRLSTKNEWMFQLNQAFTGKRYSALDNVEYQALDAYALTDVSLAKQYSFGKWTLETSIDVKNVFDTYYENLKHRAMPGRNYLVNFNIKF